MALDTRRSDSCRACGLGGRLRPNTHDRPRIAVDLDPGAQQPTSAICDLKSIIHQHEHSQRHANPSTNVYSYPHSNSDAHEHSHPLTDPHIHAYPSPNANIHPHSPLL